MKKILALSALAVLLASGTALADTSGKKIAFSNNYAGNSWRQAMLKSYEIVTKQAVDDLLRLTENARQRVLAGQTSPLEYHMYRVRMDVPLLSQASGIWLWRIRRHFRPAVFAGLSVSLLATYADAMGMTVDQLKKAD